MGKVFFEVWNTVYVLLYFIFMISGYLKMRAFIKFAKVLVLNLSFKNQFATFSEENWNP